MEKTGVFYRKPQIGVANEKMTKSTKRKIKPTKNKMSEEIKHSIFCNCKVCSDYARWKEENKKPVTTAVPGLASFPPLATGKKTEVNPSPTQMPRMERKTRNVITKKEQKPEKTHMTYGQFETPNRFAPLANLKEIKRELTSGICNVKVQKKTARVAKYRGGADNNEDQSIFERGIAVAKKHGINVKADKPNRKEGDCLFEAVVSNINERKCFPEKLEKTIQEYREEFVSEMQIQFQQTAHYPGEQEHKKSFSV